MKVKDTNLINVQVGDILLFKAKGLLQGDFLGELIATFEGGSGRYTHAARVRDLPNPEAEVEEVQPGIFKVYKSETWIEEVKKETPFEGEFDCQKLLKSESGIKLEATWPKCREWVIDWENESMEVWRCRNLTDENIADIIKLNQDMVGWDYNIAEFLTFGLLNQAAAKICSQFVAEPVYTTTLLRGCKNGNYAIALTPDLAGIKDPEITPNDLYSSGFLYKIRYQGILD